MTRPESAPRVRLLDAFADAYQGLEPGRWYALGRRGVDERRADGATRSGGGPTATAGVWITTESGDRFVFRHHVEIRDDAP